MNRLAAGFRETLRAVFSDRYAVSTLIGAVVLYSFFYPVAYRHQVASEYPVVVVDHDRSQMSRALVRKVDAVRAVRVVDGAMSMEDARLRIASSEAEGVLAIPAGFQRDILRGKPGQLALYGSGAFLGRGGTVLEGLGDAASAFAREAAMAQAHFAGAPAAPPLQLVTRPLFNTREGYGSAVVPGVAQVIVQQTLLIGMLVLAGTRRERIGPLAFSRPGLLGIASAFALIGLCSMLYYNGFVLWLQDYPRGGNPLGTLLGGALYVAAVVAFALFAGSYFRTRERPFQLLIVTSLPLFFLSGLSWPASSMPPMLVWLSKLFPSTPGVNAMVKLNQMGASLGETAPELCNLALLVLLYGALAMWRYRPASRPLSSLDG
ncbi:MAG: ABC transporter permease [Gammaproteobacteria bacterium]|nr:ABC transporter permease [Gammaproteobacteria bacterium]